MTIKTTPEVNEKIVGLLRACSVAPEILALDLDHMLQSAAQRILDLEAEAVRLHGIIDEDIARRYRELDEKAGMTQKEDTHADGS